MELLTLSNLKKGTILKRPSAQIKSPYVADILVDGKTFLGHTPSLGCGGLADKDATVYVQETPGKKCQYRVYCSIFQDKGREIQIGIAPKLAEDIIEQCLKKNLILNLDVDTYAREKTIKNSRFDFVGQQKNGNHYILEVKTVPLAHYEDVTEKQIKKMDFTNREYDSKISYFPHGYRKKKTDTISERALKHVNELREIKEQYPSIKTILCFVIQRTDVKWFQPSRLDPIYLEAVQDAWLAGVEINTVQVEWNDGVCKFVRNNLPVMLFDDYNSSLFKMEPSE